MARRTFDNLTPTQWRTAAFHAAAAAAGRRPDALIAILPPGTVSPITDDLTMDLGALQRAELGVLVPRLAPAGDVGPGERLGYWQARRAAQRQAVVRDELTRLPPEWRYFALLRADHAERFQERIGLDLLALLLPSLDAQRRAHLLGWLQGDVVARLDARLQQPRRMPLSPGAVEALFDLSRQIATRTHSLGLARRLARSVLAIPYDALTPPVREAIGRLALWNLAERFDQTPRLVVDCPVLRQQAPMLLRQAVEAFDRRLRESGSTS